MNRFLLAAALAAVLITSLAIAQDAPAPAAGATPPPAAAPVEYEYKTVRSHDKFGAGPFRSSVAVEAFLNAEGAKGWRLVASDESMLYLERVKR